jgi:RNA polymerase sigma factor (sigma-70 family)
VRLNVVEVADRGRLYARPLTRSIEEEIPVVAGQRWEGFDEQFPGLFRLSFAVAYRLLGREGDCEGIAQEAMVRTLVRWPRVKEHAEGFVCRVSTNLAVDAMRRRGRQSDWSSSKPDLIETASPDRDAAIDLATALRRLPRRQREVVACRYLADLTDEQIAAQLGISLGAVKKHAARGLAALRAGDVGSSGGA